MAWKSSCRILVDYYVKLSLVNSHKELIGFLDTNQILKSPKELFDIRVLILQKSIIAKMIRMFVASYVDTQVCV